MRRAASETDASRHFLTRRACLERQITFELDTNGSRDGGLGRHASSQHR